MREIQHLSFWVRFISLKKNGQVPSIFLWICYFHFSSWLPKILLGPHPCFVYSFICWWTSQLVPFPAVVKSTEVKTWIPSYLCGVFPYRPLLDTQEWGSWVTKMRWYHNGSLISLLLIAAHLNKMSIFFLKLADICSGLPYPSSMTLPCSGHRNHLDSSSELLCINGDFSF